MRAISLLLLAACAAESPDVDLTLENADDKADGIAGRRIALSFSDDDYAPVETETFDAKLDVRLVAADKLAVRNEPLAVLGIDVELENGTKIPLGELIQDVSFVGPANVTMGMAILDLNDHVLSCRTPRGAVNYFKRVAVDFKRNEITLNDTTTVPLTACGITGLAVRLAPIPIAWPSNFEEQTVTFTAHYVQR